MIQSHRMWLNVCPKLHSEFAVFARYPRFATKVHALLIGHEHLACSNLNCLRVEGPFRKANKDVLQNVDGSWLATPLKQADTTTAEWRLEEGPVLSHIQDLVPPQNWPRIAHGRCSNCLQFLQMTVVKCDAQRLANSRLFWSSLEKIAKFLFLREHHCALSEPLDPTPWTPDCGPATTPEQLYAAQATSCMPQWL